MKKGKSLFIFTICVYVIAGALALGYIYTNGSPMLPNENFSFDIAELINKTSAPADSLSADASSDTEAIEAEPTITPEPTSTPEPSAVPETTTEPSAVPETTPVPSAAPEADNVEYVYTHSFVAVHPEGNVNIRETSDTKSKVLGKLVPGSAGYVIAVEGDWCKIHFGDIVGYSVRSALKLTEIPQ